MIQALAALLAPSSAGGPERDAGLSDATLTALLRDVLGAAHGPAAGRYLAALVLAVVLAWACRRASGDARRLALTAWGTGLLVYLVSCVVTGQPQMRYVAVASLFAIAGFTLLGPRLERTIAIVGCGLLAALAVEGFPASTFRASGPSWSAGVRAHEAGCARGEARPIALSPDRFGGVARILCD